MSEKIKPQHVSRKAILYVRQSSPYQVMNNLESQKPAVRHGSSSPITGLERGGDHR